MTSYYVKCDWDNNNNFTGSSDEITSDVKEISFSRGKDSELGKAMVGSLTLTLNNETGKYSPSNINSPLYGNLLPRRPIKVGCITGSASTDYPLYYGFIEEIIPHPHSTEQDCVITSLDGLDYLARQELETTLLKNQLTGSVVNEILDNVGWSSSQRKIDAGQDTIPYWYGHEIKARTALNEIEDSELGFTYINCSGDFVYEDRWHRWSTTHQTSQYAFADTMVQINYSMNPSHIYNIIKSTITPWAIQASTELWRLEEIPSLDIGETKIYWGNSDFPVDTWGIPTASTDYKANSASTGLGDNETPNITVSADNFAQTVKLTITNNAPHLVYLTLLKASGTYYDTDTTVTLTKEDITSQTAYQKRTLAIAGKYQTNTDIAQGYCNVALARYKDPQPEISITVMNKNTTLLSQILTREISDRITITNTKLGLASDYFIDAMEHNISNGGLLHTVTYTLRDATNEDFWVLDFSHLGTGTKLAY
jgi:hypothetical protein